MCLCICTCVYVCMSLVYILLCMYAQVCMHVYIESYVCLCVYNIMHACIRMHACIHLCMCVGVCVYVCRAYIFRYLNKILNLDSIMLAQLLFGTHYLLLWSHQILWWRFVVTPTCSTRRSIGLLFVRTYQLTTKFAEILREVALCCICHNIIFPGYQFLSAWKLSEYFSAKSNVFINWSRLGSLIYEYMTSLFRWTWTNSPTQTLF